MRSPTAGKRLATLRTSGQLTGVCVMSDGRAFCCAITSLT